ncbi:hypothetical protein [Flavobacterium aquatile]|uniref:Lipocalin-like domain-containing protein n=1 Tax=Flavobacterium aquatile LMG 4008 = ATCC 11947 TaxID=1453498 RepID=A0A095TXR8_9FLAO|nr:hypothetical protein [Flavobacterium aquatile]KGD67128.1 hypothetical protein LG45_12945 [Flavobacterium aquatile LMG 4008 = ATCC 11947]OXA66714.1 hypothetical protein B0A61_10955 [Flavobacterium aquatile LMG 4008 = ATCC 11947]GEC78424.1 hypothetical protein FAQ01_12940 [Flavobacterium aquatile]
MKKLLLLLLTTFSLSCCNKDDDNPQTLPPATQTGAGTFACYVNGKPFIDNSGGFFNCFYQLVDGEYYFSIGGNDEDILPQNIYIQTQKRTISEGETLIFNEIADGNANAGAGFTLSITENYQSYTNTIYSGQLIITKLDFADNIVSGTFSFDILHPVTGEIIQIRDGRFDTIFTQ